eukprot:TRINITY_DN1849_c0_g1_i1.p1 TRINITY_DN1849_c0_g1~~TRINITY_DN1849_c0_g1_i1.p1  ORF type:complete len:374 (+),score=89.07 TRINITY_DN1849_c0_g1_i1:104-1225(+)
MASPVAPNSPRSSRVLSHAENLDRCRETAALLATRGKGILAADEGPEHMVSRFAAINIENNAENRQAWREVLFGMAEGFEYEKYISGVILHAETFPQMSKDGVSFVDLIRARGVLVGITVDRGGAVAEIPSTGEPLTQGIADLSQQCAAYYAKGARFTKWRAVLQTTAPEGSSFKQGPFPTNLAIKENTQALARYASIAQSNGLCPIVEPELLIDGCQDLARSEELTRQILSSTFAALHEHKVDLEGIILKPSWVIPGLGFTKTNPDVVSVADVAKATLKVLRETVPPSVHGVMFLSGGQTEDEALAHLRAINAAARATATPTPWLLSFSYGRAIQDSARKAWGGQQENVSQARSVFFEKAKSLGEASLPASS